MSLSVFSIFVTVYCLKLVLAIVRRAFYQVAIPQHPASRIFYVFYGDLQLNSQCKAEFILSNKTLRKPDYANYIIPEHTLRSLDRVHIRMARHQ